jgi:hypothetical protein
MDATHLAKFFRSQLVLHWRMQTFLLGIVIGTILGANIGLFTLALLISAKDTDEPSSSQREKTRHQQHDHEVVVIHDQMRT